MSDDKYMGTCRIHETEQGSKTIYIPKLHASNIGLECRKDYAFEYDSTLKKITISAIKI